VTLRFGWTALAFAGVVAPGGVACGPEALEWTPLAYPPQTTCPAEGCGRPPPAAEAAHDGARGGSMCSNAGGAPCGGAPAHECTERALAAWGELQDAPRALDCVAAMFSEACSLDDRSACGFAGRLWLDGRGVERDAARGIAMLFRACDGGLASSCTFAARRLSEAADDDIKGAPALRTRADLEGSCWMGQGDACYRAGLLFYFGRDAFPRDRTLAAQAYGRGCDLGDSRACNNLGDALAYGDGIARDVERAASLFDKACHLGEALGCANFGYMAEHGEGIARDAARARALYRDACTTGDAYGCLHWDMMAALDAGAPGEPTRALAHWTHACERGRDARACAFLGVLYEDGPDGMARNEAKSLEAMSRGCALRNERACEWVKSHREDDEE
jgi:TPR repeat protein